MAMSGAGFWRDRRGAGVQTLGITAGAIALAAVAATTLLDRVSKTGMPTIAFIDPKGSVVFSSLPQPQSPQQVASAGKAAQPKFDQIDRTVTGSINRITLDPCTGKQK